jgi:hypothetical protein
MSSRASSLLSSRAFALLSSRAQRGIYFPWAVACTWRADIRSLLALASLGVVGTTAAGAQQIPVKAGVTVAPDTVRVGDPFRVTVGLRVPRGATIEFPSATDSTSTVQSLDPVAVRTTADTTALEQYADYRVAAWNIGSQPILLPDAIVRFGNTQRRVPLGGHAVFVKTVLPQDSAQRVPKPPRAIYEFSIFPWWIWALIAAAIIALLLILWWWRRRRRRPALALVVDPYQRAEEEFTRIERLGLLEAGERGRYVALTVEVLRDYLAARYAEASLALTSNELVRALQNERLIPQERLARLLTDADLVKFARRPVSSERAREMGREARAIVTDEHVASEPRPEAAAA